MNQRLNLWRQRLRRSAKVEGNAFQPRRLTSRTLPEPMVRQIERVCEQFHVTREAFLLACWRVLVSRLTGEQDVVIGIGLDGRMDSDLKEAIGKAT